MCVCVCVCVCVWEAYGEDLQIFKVCVEGVREAFADLRCAGELCGDDLQI